MKSIIILMNMEKNWSYKIPDGPHAGKTLWSGRYCCVAAFVFRRINGIWSVLANKRGPGTPDFQGRWNAVCGFLEANESAERGCSREVFEETGYEIKPEKFLQVFTHTDPATSNNANVTIRHIAIFFEHELGPRQIPDGGEEGEVDDVRWISIDAIGRYSWAFNHLEIIRGLFVNYIAGLKTTGSITPGDYFLISQREWLNNNPRVNEILSKKVLSNYYLND